MQDHHTPQLTAPLLLLGPPPCDGCGTLQVKAGDVQATPLAASGGASGVGASIAEFVAAANADMVVVGSRDLHGWQRQVANLLGLGSVSYYTMCHAHCPVVVVKQQAASSSNGGS